MIWRCPRCERDVDVVPTGYHLVFAGSPCTELRCVPQDHLFMIPDPPPPQSAA